MRLKLSSLFLFVFVFCFSQNRKANQITCDFYDEPLDSLLTSIGEKIDYSFSYNSKILEKTGRFTISVDKIPIDQFLSKLLIGTGIEYSFYKDQIILNYKAVEKVSKRKNLFSISGHVKNEEDMPLANVNVFLNGTTIGAATDIDGNYKIDDIPPGYYSLVFSHVGFENSVQTISEYNGGSRIFSQKMNNNLSQLEEIQIKPDRINRGQSEWATNFVIFKNELIGTSINAEQCIIENPEVINFFYDKNDGILRAYSSAPIQIRNDRLGYSITYFLESFEKKESDLRYRGQIKFRNAIPLKREDKREWNRNRKKTFNGSFNHFRKALLSNRLKNEGFQIFNTKQLDNLGDKEKWSEISAEDIIIFKGDHYELEFKNYLIVEYLNEKEVFQFLTNTKFSSVLYENAINSDGIIVKDPGHQISIVKLLKKSVRIDLNGQVDDKFALATYGYWSWERLADLVPLNYDPKLDKL